jgi:putative transcriptional regulator
MSTIKEIRDRLKLTQTELGDAIGCTQGNVGHLERGQTMQPDTAKKLIAVAKERGLILTMDQVYGLAPLPKGKTPAVVTTDYAGPDRRVKAGA